MKTTATIVVPTRNRPTELKKLLSVLNELASEFPVLILDGSNEEFKSQNAQIAKMYRYSIHASFDANLHLGLRISDGLSRVQTEYCVMCGDDDFVFPAAIDRCVEFLQRDQEYSAAIGWVKTLEYSNTGSLRKGMILGNELEHGLDINSHQFGHRMLNYFAYTEIGSIPLYYSVRRIAELRQSFELVTGSMKYSSMELLTNLTLLLIGKIKILPTVFGIRNYSSITTRDSERHDPLTYFTDEDLDYIRNIMVDRMVREHGFDVNIAKYTIDLLLRKNATCIERVPDSLVKSRMTSLVRRAQCICSILQPDLTADYLSVDRATYRAMRKAHLASLA